MALRPLCHSLCEPGQPRRRPAGDGQNSHAAGARRDRLASSPNAAHRHQFLPGGTKPAVHSLSCLVSAAEIFDPEDILAALKDADTRATLEKEVEPLMPLWQD